MTRKIGLAASVLLAASLLQPAPARTAPDATAAPATPPPAADGTSALHKQAERKLAAKPSVRKKAAAKRTQIQPVAFIPPDGVALTPPQTEQEAREWLERDLALKVGKRRQADDYPEEAVRFGWTGTALIDVLVAGNGTIKTIALSRTSGFRVLDDQAIEMVKRVSKLWVPVRLRGRDTSVTVPIGFQMQTL
jgi:protein TonB